MYVGAFLKRPEETGSSQASAFPLASQESSEGSTGAEQEGSEAAPPAGDAAAELHEVGTLAQVHHIAPAEGLGAQLLLFGHRRLRRVRTVGSHL